MNGLEWFGTAMSAIIAISLTQKNIKKLRIFNLMGAVGFCVYGIFIMSIPVILLNGFITIADIYYLIQMRRKDGYFTHMFVDPENNEYCRQFISHHIDDIHQFIPSFDESSLKGAEACFILRDMFPVSLIVFRPEGSDQIDIMLDYAVPAYRDFENSRYFFDYVINMMNLKGISRIISHPGSDEHNLYLKKAGFTSTGKNGNQIYSKEITPARGANSTSASFVSTII